MRVLIDTNVLISAALSVGGGGNAISGVCKSSLLSQSWPDL